MNKIKNLDLLIKNGTLVDPAQGIFGKADVAIASGRVAAVGAFDLEQAVCDTVIDAEGLLVTPGLIDYHTHLFNGGSELGLVPDLLLATGVTTAVDAGTAGARNYEAFHSGVIAHSAVRIKSYISASSGGLFDLKYHPNYVKDRFNEKKLRKLKECYPGEIQGLKIMVSRNILPTNAAAVLKDVVDLAEATGDMKVCVHTTDPSCSVEEIARALRPGDVYAHCYQGTGNSIIGGDGHVLPGIVEARKRGVIFDAANGKGHFMFDVAKAAMRDGFYPDIISSDAVRETLNTSRRAKSMPYLLSKYLCMGMDLMEVIRAATQAPAKLLGMTGIIGTLAPGAAADVAIFRLDKSHPVEFKDTGWNSFTGDKVLVPQVTILGGEIVYSQVYFNIEHL